MRGTAGLLRPATTMMQFHKYHGCGNDFVVLDCRTGWAAAKATALLGGHPAVAPASVIGQAAVGLCKRQFGVGADGVLIATPASKGSGADVRMRVINGDGTEPESCGNGIRCLARCIYDIDNQKSSRVRGVCAGKGEGDGGGHRQGSSVDGGHDSSSSNSSGGDQGLMRVETLAGVAVVELLSQPAGYSRAGAAQAGLVKVDMGRPVLEPSRVPTTLIPLSAGASPAVLAVPLTVDGAEIFVSAIGMGNPHAVVGPYSDDALSTAVLDRFGPPLEVHPAFPAKTNVHFFSVLSRSRIRMLVWERGAGKTLACGTGACASVVAAVLLGVVDREGEVAVELPGGELQLEWSGENEGGTVYMTGPATKVFSGWIDVEAAGGVAASAKL